MFKNNSRHKSKFKHCSPLQFACNLISLKSEIGYYFYTKRCAQAELIKKKQ